MNEAARSRGGRGWRFPLIVAEVAALAVAAVQYLDVIESHLKFPLTLFVFAVALLVFLVWLLLKSPFPRRTRVGSTLGIVALLAAVIFGLKWTTRIDGTYTGAGVPRLAWRWSAPPDANLAALPSADPSRSVADLATTTSNDFPEFLGPGRKNALEGVHLARDWSTPPKQLWRQPIGLGWSSFAVVGDFAVTQEQRGPKELIVCYEVLGGKAVWEHENEARFSEWQGGDGPRATPTIDAGRVYALGATGILDCLDGASGKVIWSHDILADHHVSNTDYGKSSSPLIVDDLVIVTGGGSSGPSLIAYHKQTGQEAWSAGNERPGYASPVLATLAGVRQILTINSQSAAAFDVSDGHLLWHYPWPGYLPKNVQPIPLDGDRVLIGAGYGVGSAVLQVKANGSALSVEPLWSNRYLKPKFANMVVHDTFVYGLDDGILTCLDVRDGKRMWRGGRYGHGQLLLVDDLLLVQEESGDVVLVEATPSAFHELTSFPALSGKTWTCPALSGHRLLVRNDREAACYVLP